MSTVDDWYELILRRYKDGSIDHEQAIAEIKKIKEPPEMLLLTEWPKHFPYLGVSSLRRLVFDSRHENQNGFRDCWVKLEGRVYIFPKKVRAWVDRHRRPK